MTWRIILYQNPQLKQFPSTVVYVGIIFNSDNNVANIMEKTPFLIIVAIMQPLIYFISLEYFGQVVAIAIPWSILILYLIWLWASGKINFASEEE